MNLQAEVDQYLSLFPFQRVQLTAPASTATAITAATAAFFTQNFQLVHRAHLLPLYRYISICSLKKRIPMKMFSGQFELPSPQVQT